MNVALILAAIQAAPAVLQGIQALFAAGQSIANGGTAINATPEQIAALTAALSTAQSAHAQFLIDSGVQAAIAAQSATAAQAVPPTPPTT
jgi:hypothetical protein